VTRIQLTSDGHRAYLEAIEGAFGADIDYAMLNKIYGASPESAKGRYSPAECIGCRKERIEGNPNMAHVSTSYAERANLTTRMHNRRFTRLTKCVSKKFENHAHMVAIYAVWYNWVRIHKTLRVTPAMAAGLSETVMDWTDIVEAMVADAPAKKRGHYKKADDEISKLRHYPPQRRISDAVGRIDKRSNPRRRGAAPAPRSAKVTINRSLITPTPGPFLPGCRS